MIFNQRNHFTATLSERAGWQACRQAHSSGWAMSSPNIACKGQVRGVIFLLDSIMFVLDESAFSQLAQGNDRAYSIILHTHTHTS